MGRVGFACEKNSDYLDLRLGSVLGTPQASGECGEERATEIPSADGVPRASDTAVISAVRRSRDEDQQL